MAEPRIHEFETNPNTIYRHTEDVVETEWRSKISVDLNFVSICSPSTTGCCQITMAGSNTSFAINCPYDKFMALWREWRSIKRSEIPNTLRFQEDEIQRFTRNKKFPFGASKEALRKLPEEVLFALQNAMWLLEHRR